jgi:hypothetical protein
MPLAAFVSVWLVYLVLAAVRSRSSRVGKAEIIYAVALSTAVFFIRGLVAGASLDSMLYGSALLSGLILLITLGDPSLMFDIHQVKGKKFRRLSKSEQARVKARDRRSGISQLLFIVVVVAGVSCYVGFGWKFLG